MNPSLESLIGTQAFLPAVLAHIRDAASQASLPVDQVIFQSILLSLIAKDKHLIIRTPEEDVSLAVKLIVWTLSTVFNLQTQKVKVRKSRKPSRRPVRPSTPSSSTLKLPKTTPDNETFLRSIFIHPAVPPLAHSNSNHAFQDETSTLNDGHSRSHSTYDQQAVGSSRKQQMSKHARRKSFPNSLSAAAHAQMHGEAGYPPETSIQTMYPPESIASAVSTTSTTTFTSTITSPSIMKPQPLYAYSVSQTPISAVPSPRLPHAYTDPLPTPSRRKKARSQAASLHHEEVSCPKALPQALVVSGLEHSDLSVQRALSSTLGEKRIVLDNPMNQGSSDEDDNGEYGSWILPEGFICVYVCPLNARDRPGVHKTLLDKFAMSTNLLIPQNIRNDFQLLPFALSSSLPSPNTFHSSISKSNPGSPSSLIHIPLPTSQTPPVHTKALPGHGHGHIHGHHGHSYSYHHHRSSTHYNMSPTTPIHPTTPALLSQSLSIPNSYQTASTTPIRLPLLLPVDFLKWLRDAFQQTRVAYTLDLYFADLMSAVRHNSRLDGTLLTAKCTKDGIDLAKASRVVGTDLTGMELIRPTEVDNEEGKQVYPNDDEDFHSTHSNPTALIDPPHATPPKVFEVSEVDIARIFPRVVSHRVRLRDSPEDEILASALYGATFKPPVPPDVEEEEEIIHNSVKSVLVSILSEV